MLGYDEKKENVGKVLDIILGKQGSWAIYNCVDILVLLQGSQFSLSLMYTSNWKPG